MVIGDVAPMIWIMYIIYIYLYIYIHRWDISHPDSNGGVTGVTCLLDGSFAKLMVGECARS